MGYLGVPPQSGFISQEANQYFTGLTQNYIDLNQSISSLSSVIILVNGVVQENSTLTLTTSSRITLGATLIASDKVTCIYLAKISSTQAPASSSVTNDMLAGSIADAKITDLSATKLTGTIPTARLGSGTASSSTVLYGDNTFKAEPSGETNVPLFSARASGNQAISDSTATKVNFGQEDIDTNSAFASSKFTVPSGQAGKYFFTSNLVSSSQDGVSTMRTLKIFVYKDGSHFNSMGTYTDNRNNYLDSDEVSYAFVLDLAVGDEIEIYAEVISSSGGGGNLQGNKCRFDGFKVTA